MDRWINKHQNWEEEDRKISLLLLCLFLHWSSVYQDRGHLWAIWQGHRKSCGFFIFGVLWTLICPASENVFTRPLSLASLWAGVVKSNEIVVVRWQFHETLDMAGCLIHEKRWPNHVVWDNNWSRSDVDAVCQSGVSSTCPHSFAATPSLLLSSAERAINLIKSFWCWDQTNSIPGRDVGGVTGHWEIWIWIEKYSK